MGNTVNIWSKSRENNMKETRLQKNVSNVLGFGVFGIFKI